MIVVMGPELDFNTLEGNTHFVVKRGICETQPDEAIFAFLKKLKAEEEHNLQNLYWIPKLQNHPSKQRHIANSTERYTLAPRL